MADMDIEMEMMDYICIFVSTGLTHYPHETTQQATCKYPLELEFSINTTKWSYSGASLTHYP